MLVSQTMRPLLLLCLFSFAVAAAEKPKWWSLQPVVAPPVPPGVDTRNPIDAFLGERQRSKGLQPAAAGDKLTLLRRASFDLVGLPPTPTQQQAFLSDNSPNAYAKLVDQLLSSEQHGVRWARHWLDILRYADLDGLDGAVMPAAPGIYRWRDWVIHALNEDLPYDQFVRAQILGNRHRSVTSVSATGKRRRGEPNPQDQFALGFLARAAITRGDRDQDIALQAVETVSSAFLGLTVACARCHDHKFDPIKQVDFYGIKALFDPLVLRRVSLSTPEAIYAHGQTLEAFEQKKAPIEAAIDQLIGPYQERLYDERVAQLPPDVQAIIRKPERKRTQAEQKIADDYSPVLRIDPPKLKEIMPKDAIAQYDALLKQDRALTRPSDLPSHWTVEEDSARLERKTYILTSGDPARPEKDKPVQPGFPFKPEEIDFRDGRREGFVDWLTAPDNPLFARVVVNRIWQWHFGEGLHKTPSDFGLLGGKPAMQPLLDYLAAEFVAHDYSMKWLHRLIMTSDAYQRSSRPDAANRKIDPTNTYLWRFPLRRLEAEPVWDAILASAGELDLAVGGKSFQVVQPDNKQSIFLPRDGTFDSKNTSRRGIYMARGYIPSTEVMAQFLQTFDVDDGRTPCPLRSKTVTAPQALFSMNDPLIERATTKLAERVMKESAGQVPAAVDLAFRHTIGRPPSPSERDLALTHAGNGGANLKGLAWMLFNLDEFLFIK